jgi:hypothetical protein
VSEELVIITNYKAFFAASEFESFECLKQVGVRIEDVAGVKRDIWELELVE